MGSTDATHEADLLVRLRAGDEAAFTELVAAYHARLVRLASAVIARTDLAEDAVQETWLAVLRGIDRFEARSSLQSWLFQICANRARSLVTRERPSVALDTAVDQPGPDGDLARHELSEELRHALYTLPASQRQVVQLRDVAGLTGPEVCAALSLSESNQRVLLHRGRAGLRRALRVA